MNVNLGKTTFTPEELAAVRAAVRAASAESSLSQADVSRQSEVPSSSLSQFLNGNYPGDNNPIAAKLERWLKARAEEAEFRNQQPQAPTFLPLKASLSIRHQLAYARQTGRLVQVGGMPGTSKTSTAKQFHHDTPQTWYAAMDSTTGGVQAMLLEILAAMGQPEAKGSPQGLMRMIKAKVSGDSGCLIIVDEAQHLTLPAIEALRALNDATRVGIAILGNEAANARIGVTGVKQEFAQVSSRVAARKWLQEPEPSDAATLAQAYAAANDEVIGAKEVAFCQQIASKPGGLRNIEMTMEGALMAARGAQQPLTVEYLQGAFAQLSGLGHGR